MSADKLSKSIKYPAKAACVAAGLIALGAAGVYSAETAPSTTTGGRVVRSTVGGVGASNAASTASAAKETTTTASAAPATAAPAPGATPTVPANASGALLNRLTNMLNDETADSPASTSPEATPSAQGGTTVETAQDAVDKAEDKQLVAQTLESGGFEVINKLLGLENPPELFANADEIVGLLGNNPRWVWKNDPTKGRPDPMLVPWVAENLIFQTQDAEARRKEQNGELKEAKEMYSNMLTFLTDPVYITKTQERIAELDKLIVVQNDLNKGNPDGNIVLPQLPQSVIAGTRGIIYDPRGSSWVTVGTQLLTVGDTVEGSPNVKIQSVDPQVVTYRVTNEFASRDIPVKVQGDAVEDKDTKNKPK